MKLTTITTKVNPILIDALLESGVAIAPDGDHVIVEADRVETVEKFLRMFGFEPQRTERFLETALDSVATKYQIDEFIRFEAEEEPTPRAVEDKVGRKKLVSFIQRKIRETRKTRSKKRKQHVRDELTGKVRAYEEILRRIKAA